MRKTEYKNRDGDIIVFTQTEPDTVEMTGYHNGSFRVIGGEIVNGYVENPTAVDPSGGPYVSVGSKIPDTEWVVDCIVLGGEKVIFKIKQ
jgi:hypothetical protein